MNYNFTNEMHYNLKLANEMSKKKIKKHPPKNINTAM